MITIELTNEKLEHLIEGAQQYGRCSLLVESTEGDDVAVVVTANMARRSRRQRAQRSGANHEPADAIATGALK